MDRKIIAAISLGLLFIAFGLVSALVILTKRNPYFVGKKLRLGALILSISGTSIGCFTTTCYEPAPTNNFHIDQAIASSDSIVVHRAISDTITGTISERRGNTFSYAVLDSSDSTVVKGNIEPIDKNFDEDVEEFKIGLGVTILPGVYSLRFFNAPTDSIQHFDWYARSFTLAIED